MTHPDRRVAVVIPCFNDGPLLLDALRSLEDQEPCEVVVVDDGSDDPRTLAVLDSLAAAGQRVVRQANAGPAAARMAGVRATSAPYVHPLDADDRFPPGAIAALADALDADGAAGVAWGDYRTFGATDCHFPSARELDPWRITYLDEIPGTSMIRRTSLLAVGGWHGGGYEDWDLWMRLAESGERGVRVPRVTLLYRVHPTARRYRTDLLRHNEHYQQLRDRHARLFARRRAAWRRSRSPWGLKLLLPAIDALPGLDHGRKQKLWGLARYLVQPGMASSCYRGPLERLRRR